MVRRAAQALTASNPARPRSYNYLAWTAAAVVLLAILLGLGQLGYVPDLLNLPYNTLIVLAGTSLLGACSGLVGTFAVLRGRALMGDALSHAALPGLCVAFLLVGERSLPAMLLGALVSGILGVMIVSFLRSATRIKEDAAIGIVLGVFFGAGISLSRVIQNQTTTGSKAGLESYILGKTAGMIPQDVYLIGGVSLVCLLLVMLLYKEFKVVSFDPGFARVQGWPVLPLDVLLMALVSLTVVIGLPAVGVVLMAAMLIIPAAAARFWTERLGAMLVIAATFGAATGAMGTMMSAQFRRVPAGPVIVLVGTGIFLYSVLMAPRRGGIARLVERLRFRARLAEQGLLSLLLEATGPGLTADEVVRRRGANERSTRRLLARAERAGLAERDASGRYRLTDAGEQRARQLTRARQLWHLFLTEYQELVSSYADLDAESLSGSLPADVLEELEARLGTHDAGGASQGGSR